LMGRGCNSSSGREVKIMRPPALPAAALCHERVSCSRRDHVPATLFSHLNPSCRLHSRLKNRQEDWRALDCRGVHASVAHRLLNMTCSLTSLDALTASTHQVLHHVGGGRARSVGWRRHMGHSCLGGINGPVSASSLLPAAPEQHEASQLLLPHSHQHPRRRTTC
jgi:hypothetical protein